MSDFQAFRMFLLICSFLPFLYKDKPFTHNKQYLKHILTHESFIVGT